VVFIRQERYYQGIVKVARRIYKAERVLVTHCLTLVVLVMLIGSAAYVDARIRPEDARASLITSQAQTRDFPSDTQAAPGPQSEDTGAPQPQPEDTGLPPTLAQNTQNLDPELIRRFDAFRTFIFTNYGVTVEIRSGFRSYEEQAELYRTLPRGQANPPGQSNHETGGAVDYTNYSPEYNQHLANFGLTLPFAGKEDWHIEMAGT
jgi:hypothetical protein